jgi:hypothetical protein
VKRTTSLILLTCLLLVGAISGVALANDGRINPPPYHFGGDALYCNHDDGCTLLNKTGQFLFNWSQAEIDAALTIVEQTGAKALVGEGTGSYGPAEIWAVPPEEPGDPLRLCFFGYDEWGKQNHMCFGVLADRYLPAPIAVGTPATEVPVADCSMWDTGMFVRIIGTTNFGPIISIDPITGTVTFEDHSTQGDPPVTAGCDEVEIALI